jgi:hypothetical protein
MPPKCDDPSPLLTLQLLQQLASLTAQLKELNSDMRETQNPYA